jgi:hypothetical protein
MLSDLMHKIQSLFSTEETGFKVVGNNWFARYSNAFKDREGEYFPTEAIDRFVDRVDSGVIPAPELWVWHTPIVVGKAKTVARLGLFVVAAGTFADTPFAQAAKTYLQSHKAKLSHGFVFDVEQFKDHGYYDYNTFEISILPFAKGVEANAYTNIEVKDMSISKEKEAFFVEMFGEATAKELIDSTHKASKVLEELGVQYKDFADVKAMQKPDAPEVPTDEDEDEDAPTKKKDTEVLALVVDNVKSIAEVAEGQQVIVQAVRGLQQSMQALQTQHTKAVADLQAENKALRDELALSPRGVRASLSDETVIDNKDLQDKLSTKEKEQPKDDFWSFALKNND